VQEYAISAESLGHCSSRSSPTLPHALENGELLFDFSTARYSISGEGKCVLHMWSDERNAVRRVLDVAVKPRSLRLSVLRFGQSQPTVLEVCADRDQRSATALRGIRARYRQIFERLLLRELYREALKVALAQKGMRVASERTVQVSFRGIVVGVFRTDLVVNDKIVLELKTAKAIDSDHEAQLLNYLKATDYEVGLLFNFGPRPQFWRLRLDNEYKAPTGVAGAVAKNP